MSILTWLQKRRFDMKKFTLSGIIAIISITAVAALAYGEMSGPGAKHEMPGGPGMAGHQMGQGMPMGSGMGHGMMMGHGMGMGGQGMGHGMMGGCGMRDRMMERAHHLLKSLESLDLDEQQKKMIHEIKSRIMKETIRKMADIRIAQIELGDLLLQDPTDMKLVEAKVKQLGMMRTEMALAHLKALEEIKGKLTPEQRKKFREMMKTGPMMGRMGMMH
jgi:Spy/CpxP family protein refolding chaperone